MPACRYRRVVLDLVEILIPGHWAHSALPSFFFFFCGGEVPEFAVAASLAAVRAPSATLPESDCTFSTTFFFFFFLTGWLATSDTALCIFTTSLGLSLVVGLVGL